MITAAAAAVGIVSIYLIQHFAAHRTKRKKYVL